MPENDKATLVQQFNVNFISGTVTGVFCSAALNFWDRALYLSVVHKRPFLTKANFSSPFQGVVQAATQRGFLGSIYYIIQGELNHYLTPHLQGLGFSATSTQFYTGLLAGSINGLLTNGVSAVKYHTWGQEKRSFFSSIKEMKLQGGSAAFTKGTIATIGRDSLFGITYEVVRHEIQNKTKAPNPVTQFFCNAGAASIATIASGPLNYARTIQYGTAPNIKPPTIRQALKDVWSESKLTPSYLGRLGFFQQRFRVGWGTGRVAVGMALGQAVFDTTRTTLNELYEYRA